MIYSLLLASLSFGAESKITTNGCSSKVGCPSESMREKNSIKEELNSKFASFKEGVTEYNKTTEHDDIEGLYNNIKEAYQYIEKNYDRLTVEQTKFVNSPEVLKIINSFAIKDDKEKDTSSEPIAETEKK